MGVNEEAKLPTSGRPTRENTAIRYAGAALSNPDVKNYDKIKFKIMFATHENYKNDFIDLAIYNSLFIKYVWQV